MITTESEPTARRWTRSEYYSMAEIGLFEGQRVELIDGEVVIMSPHSHFHASSVSKVAQLLRSICANGFWTREEKALLLNDRTLPEPDISVVRGSEDDYDDHPTTAELVVEISGSTLKTDQTKKASIYAKAGIEDYWIVNLWGRCVEVRRKPTKDVSGAYFYASVETVGADGFVAMLIKPESHIAVTHMLPPERLAQM